MAQQEFMEALSAEKLPAWEALPDFGLYMDQVLALTERYLPRLSGIIGLTPAMINNYVKAGLIDRPQGKKYSRDALAQLFMVILLKQALTQDSMKRLLHPMEAASTEAIYRAFLEAQEKMIIRYQDLPEVTPLSCALESAALSLAFQMTQSPSDA